MILLQPLRSSADTVLCEPGSAGPRRRNTEEGFQRILLNLVTVFSNIIKYLRYFLQYVQPLFDLACEKNEALNWVFIFPAISSTVFFYCTYLFLAETFTALVSAHGLWNLDAACLHMKDMTQWYKYILFKKPETQQPFVRDLVLTDELHQIPDDTVCANRLYSFVFLSLPSFLSCGLILLFSSSHSMRSWFLQVLLPGPSMLSLSGAQLQRPGGLLALRLRGRLLPSALWPSICGLHE